MLPARLASQSEGEPFDFSKDFHYPLKTRMVDQMVDQDEVKNEYEIACLLKEEADFKDLLALLRQSEAVVTFEGRVKKIVWAYEIAKQSAAYFGWLRFTAPTHRICEIEHALILHHTVLRSLIVKFTPG